jgi:hypothetical protein
MKNLANKNLSNELLILIIVKTFYKLWTWKMHKMKKYFSKLKPPGKLKPYLGTSVILNFFTCPLVVFKYAQSAVIYFPPSCCKAKFGPVVKQNLVRL